MDPTAQPIQPTSPTPMQTPLPKFPIPTKPSSHKNIGKMILTACLEFLFVAFLLSLVFGMLNYFNVINANNIFSQLSFLPHKVATQQPSLSRIHAPFAYNFPKAQDELTAYQTSVITKAFLPVIATGSAGSFVYIQKENIFTSIWSVQTENSSTSARISSPPISLTDTLIMLPNTDSPSQYQLSIRSSSNTLFTLPSMPTSQAVQLAAEKIFTTTLPSSTWHCTQSTDTPICTATLSTKSGKNTYVISFLHDPQNSQTTIIDAATCLVPQNSPLTNKKISCSL